MSPIRWRADRWTRAAPGCHAGWPAFASCVLLALVSPPVTAQVPTSSREELVRQWDINRDGKVDASEAEIARGRMRRARNDAIINSGNDPVTGKPRVATDPITGRPVPRDAAAADRSGLSAPADDDGLILVPGNGERPGATGSSAGKESPPRPSQRDREPLPGTRAPSMSSTIPSVAPRLPASGAPPGAGSASNAGAGARPPGIRPGIIAGGTRAGVPGAKPGSGAAAPAGDLNAGRLPGGLPQTRGVAPGTVAGPRVGPLQQPNTGRLGGQNLGPNPPVPRPGIGPYRGATSPVVPSPGATSRGATSRAATSTSVPSVPRPGVRQPDGRRPVSPTPNTVPRVPRMTTDEFYGR
jgi:hypothetical protein